MPWAEPVSWTLVPAVTGLVLAGNAALVCPAPTCTVVGTVTAAVLDDASETVNPPAGAFAFSVTVPTAAVPPCTEVGFSVSAETTGGYTVKSVWRVTPRDEAESASCVSALTGKVVT